MFRTHKYKPGTHAHSSNVRSIINMNWIEAIDLIRWILTGTKKSTTLSSFECPFWVQSRQPTPSINIKWKKKETNKHSQSTSFLIIEQSKHARTNYTSAFVGTGPLWTISLAFWIRIFSLSFRISHRHHYLFIIYLFKNSRLRFFLLFCCRGSQKSRKCCA